MNTAVGTDSSLQAMPWAPNLDTAGRACFQISLLESCLGNGGTWLLGNGKSVYLSGQSGECDCDAENAPSDHTDVYLVSSTRTSFKSDPCYIK